jgi:vancomycin aglycone glucosyltransferase
MRVLLSTFGSRGDVQPLIALAVALQSLGADARVCAPADEEFAQLFAAAGVPLLPAFSPVRPWLAEMLPKRKTLDLRKLAAEVISAQYEAVSAAAQGCDVLVATGLFSCAAAAKSVAEQLGLRYVLAAFCPFFLPSPYQRPYEYLNHPFPPGMTDNQALWDLNAKVMNTLFGEGFNNHRASIGLPKVDNVRDQSSRASRGSLPIPCLHRGGRRRISMSCRPARGFWRTSGPWRLTCWNFSKPARHPCT